MKTQWFLVELDDRSRTKFVVYAENEQLATSMIGVGYPIHLCQRLTWRTISKLLGCMKPTGKKDTEFAFGPLTFNRDCNICTLWPY